MYTAMNIASEIILRYKQHGKGITNLKLQKVLYYAQVESLQENNHTLFNDDIEAWRHGPVVPSVYFSYRRFISSDIDPDDRYVIENIASIDVDVKHIIENVVDMTLTLDAWDMVEKMQKAKPWIDNYIVGENRKIPIDEIKRYGVVNLH